MENEAIDKKFNDIDEKVDFIIELCQTLQAENAELTSKVEILESELKEKREKESLQIEQQSAIQSKIDKLLSKLDNFSEIL
ncbi:MAG: cell division protein ZapB [Desulfamplus sp.]|nr:cell division protein ZapB [Desulfamplus sp.]